MKLAAIIVAAGSSRRMGFDKLLAPLSGKPVLQWSIEAFARSEQVNEIIIVCPEDRYAQLDLSSLAKSVQRIDGGRDRHDSVAAGLSLVSESIDFVAVHDGARPLITVEQIERVYSEAILHQSAASAKKVTETVKRANADGFVISSVDRENLWLMETPQIFNASLLNQAYDQVMASGERVTDEVSAMDLMGQKTQLVTNATANPKITFPEDIAQAESLRP